MLFNHSDNVFSVQVGQRIAQIVFLETFDVKFEMVQSADHVDKSVRNEGGFGSTGNNWFSELAIKMTTNNLLNEDDKKLLAEENEIWNEKFQGFHKKVFNKMRTQAIFLQVKILEWNRKKPGDDDFKDKINVLIKQIIKEKIELMGTYLKCWFIVWFYLVMVEIIKKIRRFIFPMSGIFIQKHTKETWFMINNFLYENCWL